MKISGENQVSYCIAEQRPCIFWVQTYFKDCLCNLNDELSFAFGFLSLVCWGVAEIPQIITNFRTKSGHGISVLFLLTWIVGDIFNVVGCLLEPATLPTQYYIALLYTTTTIVLLLQSLYYDYFFRLLKRRKLNDSHQPEKELKKPLIQPTKAADSGIPIPNVESRRRAEFCYTSARSLAGSLTPPIRAVRSGPSGVGIADDDSSSDVDEEIINNASNTSTNASQPKPISPFASSAAFLATMLNMPPHTSGLIQASFGLAGRKLLQDNVSSESYVVGQLLGWMMAAIYMCGRIPQIWLNIKRGSVEGLNPLMFVFALIANLAYVGSILVRSTEWEKIKANMPWLLDAAVCVVLDLFIIMQYIYYKYFRKSDGREEHGDFIEAS